MPQNIDNSKETPLLTVKNLKKYFPVEGGLFQRLFSREQEYVHAVDDISFSINQGEIFCLVGESGCGKTTAANVIIGLEQPTAGKFKWKGSDITYDELKPKKGNIKSQVVFQNPFSSLSPRMRLGDAVLHSLVIHNRVDDEDTKKKHRNSLYSEIALVISSFLAFILLILAFILEEMAAGISALLGVTIFAIALFFYFYLVIYQKGKIKDTTVLELFNEIGLTPSNQYYAKYPNVVSGGERQRVSIARAIVLNPELLVADEPTSMLDVSLRAGILDQLKEIQTTHNISILFITHDLATARHFGDRVAVMYVGKIVEIGDVEEMFKKPFHPYTNALIDAIPTPIPGEKKINLPKGEVPDSITPPSGCRFHPRCPIADPSICTTEEPKLVEQNPHHFVACHFPLIK
ncbi:MAG: oligopeptide/dipeptide ABC transporter ATP-binding protein [Candidatus Hodarchaeota archaeon]